MITVSTEAYLEGPNPSIPVPGVPEGMYQVVVVLQQLPKRKRRRAGFSKAKIQLSNDFNAPLDDLKPYMQ